MTDTYILRWKDLFRPGTNPPVGSEAFARAPQGTTALLLVDRELTGDFKSVGSQHAEHRLLQSEQWKSALQTAAAGGVAARSEPLTIAVVINRSPCHFRAVERGHPVFLSRPAQEYFEAALAQVPGEALNEPSCGCSFKLASALVEFTKQHAVTGVKFLLACTGLYWPDDKPTVEHQGMTKKSDLAWLQLAGWDVRALEVDGNLTDRGRELIAELKAIEPWVGRRP